MKKNFLALAVVAVIAVAATATDANAVCAVQKLFGSFDTTAQVYKYVFADAAATTDTLVGRFWQQGNFANGNDGTYDDSIWLLPYGSGKFGVSGAMASVGVVGCPVGRLNVLFQSNTTGNQFVTSVFETPGDALWWNLTRPGSDFVLAPISRARLTNRQVSANIRTFDVLTDAVTGTSGDAGAPALVTSYRLMQQRKPTGQAAPTNAIAGWTEVGNVAPGATLTGFQIDCTAADQVYLAIRNQYDSGQYSGDIVGPITRVSCDPNLADPNSPNFKVIKKTSKIPTNKPNIE